jgi:hypothetical protein
MVFGASKEKKHEQKYVHVKPIGWYKIGIWRLTVVRGRITL